jgi:dGTPase
MDWADDITYAVHDLEDFFRAGRVPLARIIEDAEELATFVSTATSRLSSKPGYDAAGAAEAFRDILKLGFTSVRHYRGAARDLAALHKTSSFLINRYASAVRVQGGDQPLHVPASIRHEVDMLKQLTWHYVIHDPSLATLQQGHTKIVELLFDALTEWLRVSESDGSTYRLPTRLRELYRITDEEEGSDVYQGDPARRRARAVADYISSLTEDQALDLHERLSGVAKHSVLDPWMAY